MLYRAHSHSLELQVPRKAAAPGFGRLIRLLERLGAPGSSPTPGRMIQDVLEGGYGEYRRAEFPEEEEEEEERRLFYVAVTRARDELALSYPISAVLRGGERAILRLSRFIEELPGGEEAPYDRLILETRNAQDGS